MVMLSGMRSDKSIFQNASSVDAVDLFVFMEVVIRISPLFSFLNSKTTTHLIIRFNVINKLC